MLARAGWCEVSREVSSTGSAADEGVQGESLTLTLTLTPTLALALALTLWMTMERPSTDISPESGSAFPSFVAAKPEPSAMKSCCAPWPSRPGQGSGQGLGVRS